MFMCTEEPTNQNAIRAGVQQPVLGSVHYLDLEQKSKVSRKSFNSCFAGAGIALGLSFISVFSFILLFTSLYSVCKVICNAVVDMM